MIAVPSVGTYPFRMAASTSAFAGPSRNFSSRMIAASSSLRRCSMNARHCSSTSPKADTACTNSSMRSRLLCRLGLDITARRISTGISLSSPSPASSRCFSTSMRT